MFAKLKKKIQEETQNVTGTGDEKKVRPAKSGSVPNVNTAGQDPPSPKPARSVAPLSSPHGHQSVSSPGPGLASPVGQNFQGVGPFSSPALSRTSINGESRHRTASESSPYEPGDKDKEEILTMLIKRTDQVKKLESKITELAAVVREKNKQVENLEDSLQMLNTDTQQQHKLESSVTNQHKAVTDSEKTDGQADAVLDTEAELQWLKEQLRIANKHKEKLQDELKSLHQEMTTLREKCKDLEEKNEVLEQRLSAVQSSREDILSRNSHFEKDLKELQQYKQQYVTLKTKYESLQTDTELAKKKLCVEVETKKDQCEHLKEKVALLEKRLKDSQLSDSDQLKAAEKQRESLEQRLTEAQEQLSQVKVISSHKVAALEQKLLHLNKNQRDFLEMKNSLEKEIESWKSKLQMALLEVKEKNKQLEGQKQSHEAEIARRQKSASLLENELNEQINQLKCQLQTMEKARERERQATQDKIAKLETKQEGWLEEEIDLERRITQLEDDLHKHKMELSEKERDVFLLRQQLQQKEQQLIAAERKGAEHEESRKQQEKNADTYHTSMISLEKELHTCTKEKDNLMLRNAQLSQEFESYKRQLKSELDDFHYDTLEKDRLISQLEQSATELQQQVSKLQEKISELERKQVESMEKIQCEQIAELRQKLSDAEGQLSEKSKTIKMLQQRLNELKKTLQRELKVQSLPNDESSSRNTPSSSSGQASVTNSLSNSHLQDQSSPASISVTTQQTVDHKVVHHTRRLNFTNRHQSAPEYHTNHALIPQDAFSKRQMENSSSRGHYCDPKDFSYEINFEYLKHVVLKFLLSREHEAVHLIKALAMLLHFTPDEQRLIKETLDWKMSWFGTRPQLGRGQLAKVIPSSY